MSSLVTNLSPEELRQLQVEMADPANVEKLHKELPEAVAPAFLVRSGALGSLPLRITESPEGFTGLGEHPPGTRVTCEGNVTRIYHQDPDRYEKAKEKQPEPGEKRTRSCSYPWGEVGWHGTLILRMDDGRLVLQTQGCCEQQHLLLHDPNEASRPDSPIPPE